jgi:TolB protein
MSQRLHVDMLGRTLVMAIAVEILPGSTAELAHSQIASTSTIVFVSTRDEPDADPALDPQRAWAATEIYASDETWTSVRRLTKNTVPDFLPSLSPDGTRVAFDSTRRRIESEPLNTSDVFVMNADGTDQQWLVRGSSATWSPDGRRIAFHASASGTGLPIKADPGAATQDSDIFIIDGNDGLRSHAKPRNLTATPAAIDDDADWSPDGRTIVFTSHAATDNPVNSATAEIYAIEADGAGKPVRLTNNAEEERAPSWSPDGKRIVFCCRRNGPDFEICVMNADGTGQAVLTDNSAPDLTPTWSPDSRKIVFHRPLGGTARFQLFSIAIDGSGETQLTFPPGLNAFPNWESTRPRRGVSPGRQ